MDCLTKADVEERFKFVSEDAKFCPDCLVQLREIVNLDDNTKQLYCPNEMCRNDDQYDIYGNSFSS